MNKTISLDNLPRQVENLLRATWEGHESLVLEQDGKPVAAIIPMDEYRKLHPDGDENTAYELPVNLLEAYHSLLDKKFSTGLTPEEEIELSQLDQHLDDAEATQPLIQSMRMHVNSEDQKWMRTLEEVIVNLRNLRKST